MDYRIARPSDQPALAAFDCNSSGSRYEEEVEEFIRTRVWAWSLQREGDPRLLVLSENGRLVGVAAHRQAQLTISGRAQPARKLEVLALQTPYQGETRDGVRLSSALISAALADIEARDPDASPFGIVHSSNARSIGLLARAGLTNLVPYGPPYLLAYS